MSDTDLNALKNIEAKAIYLWEKITGQEIDAHKFLINIGGQRFNLYDANHRLKTALEVDETGISTLLIFRHVYDAFIDNQSFSMRTVIESPEIVRQEIDDVLEINSCLHNEITNPYLDGFVERMKEALEHYGVSFNPENLDSIIGYLRLDALIGLNNLHKSAFLDSANTVGADQVKYSKQIFKFWNINSLIRLSPKLNNGITLCLIEEADIADSYFVFAVKNGGNFSIVTDKQKWEYPGQSSRKRNHRQQIDRMGAHWFPYELLDIEYSEDSKRIYKKSKSSSSLVAYQDELITLGSISGLDIKQSSWIIMMFDLIKERYFHRNVKDSLTYTGSMVVSEKSLRDESKSLPIAFDKSILMPKITVKDVLRENIESSEPKWSKLTFYNKWMEDRYSKNVSDDVLVHLGSSDDVFYLQDLTKPKGLITTEKSDDGPNCELMSVDPAEFGTKEEIVKDVKWVARYNLAKAIQLQLNAEHKREEDNIKKWYVDQVKNHLPELIKKLVYLDEDYFNIPADEQPHQFGGSNASSQTRVYRKIHSATYSPFSYNYRIGHSVTDIDYKNHYLSWGDGSRATLFFLIEVNNALDLPNVTGIEREKLPTLLRYYKMKGYNGNSILDRLDPVDESIRNPWDSLRLSVLVPLSKRMFHRLRKEQGLSKISDFQNEFVKKGIW